MPKFKEKNENEETVERNRSDNNTLPSEFQFKEQRISNETEKVVQRNATTIENIEEKILTFKLKEALKTLNSLNKDAKNLVSSKLKRNKNPTISKENSTISLL